MSDKVPEDAKCEICGTLIGMEEAVSVQEVDEDTEEPVGELKWFHKACLE